MSSIIGYTIGFVLGAIIGSSIMWCIIVKIANNNGNKKIKDKKKKISVKCFDESVEPFIVDKVGAPHNGAIYRYCKQDGEYVKKGDIVLVFESCKMEFEVKAPAEGYVKYNYLMGEHVQTNDILFGISTMQFTKCIAS